MVVREQLYGPICTKQIGELVGLSDWMKAVTNFKVHVFITCALRPASRRGVQTISESNTGYSHLLCSTGLINRPILRCNNKLILDLDILRTVHRDIFVQWRTRCTISQLYFNIQLYMFWTDLLFIIKSLDTVFTATASRLST